MNSAFWNLFTDDYRKNCLAWRHQDSPILPPSGHGWQSTWTANPDLLTVNGNLLLYYRGNGLLPGSDDLHDRIAVFQVSEISESSLHLKVALEGDVVLDIGNPTDFDGVDVLDPASVVFKGRVFLYYSAIGDGPDSVGLAISEDGIHFKKHGFVMVGRAPDVIVDGDRLAMVYQRADPSGNYQVYLAESKDGIHFSDVCSEPIFPRNPGSWDSLSIATVRLARDGEFVYAIYGGSSYLADEPEHFGLARSTNLRDWEFHPGNPIFGCGAKGMPDGGAIWFPALHEADDAFVMLYEGSRGKYSWDLSSAICMASISKLNPELT